MRPNVIEENLAASAYSNESRTNPILEALFQINARS
jgi:hypothetical protein